MHTLARVVLQSEGQAVPWKLTSLKTEVLDRDRSSTSASDFSILFYHHSLIASFFMTLSEGVGENKK